MENQQNIVTLDDLYFKDAFTKTTNGIDMEANQITVNCLTSKENKFRLDNNGNLTVKSITAEEGVSFSEIGREVIANFIYPVGAIYLSMNSINPKDIFGGKWEQLKDTFLLACGNNHPINTSGGEESHTLTIAEMPNHNHNSKDNDAGYFAGWGDRKGWMINSANLENGGQYETDYTGESKPHNNMPPYITCYMWKRIE